ncbi:hypothetical protein CERZMDRAFT_100297 [Cercospora zeae-maydis SCOH1-5]|uniref:Uncharacterized protein n=1 Tax=Cercospora zeae-maydis SCOH1-5 TaxID=717836 RepID=A0A6A6F7R6_9PEZI|nr:hypothetical protein CERZMDRAFT_100297 [Cercospora zeae-maydis SCOH1-5]
MLAFGALASAVPYPGQESTGSIKGPPDSSADTLRSEKSKRQFEFGSLIDYWSQKAQASAHEKDPPSTLSRRSQEGDPDMLELSWAPIQARHLRKRELSSSYSTSAAAGPTMLTPAVTLSDPQGHTTSSLLKARALPKPPAPSHPFSSSSDNERKQHPELMWAPIQAKRDLAKRSDSLAMSHGLEYATSIRPTSSNSDAAGLAPSAPSSKIPKLKPRHRRTQAVDFGSPLRLPRDDAMVEPATKSSEAEAGADALAQDLLEQAAALAPVKAKKRDVKLSAARWEAIGDAMKQRRRDWRMSKAGSGVARVLEG